MRVTLASHIPVSTVKDASETSAGNTSRIYSFAEKSVHTYVHTRTNPIRFYAKTAECDAGIRARERAQRYECIFQERCCIRLLADRKKQRRKEGAASSRGTLLAGTSILMGMGFSTFTRHMCVATMMHINANALRCVSVPYIKREKCVDIIYEISFVACKRENDIIHDASTATMHM